MLKPLRHLLSVTGALLLATGSGAKVPAQKSGQPESGGPRVTQIPAARIEPQFAVAPAYQRADHAHVRVVGAFTIAPPPHTRLLAAWSLGFLPITLSFSDGRCYVLTADYLGGALSNGRLAPSKCDGRPAASPPRSAPPAGSALRFGGMSWGYAAWINDRMGTTIVTAPYSKTFQPLFTARFPVAAIMAMNGPDSPTGNVTLVGPVAGRLTVVTLAVAY